MFKALKKCKLLLRSAWEKYFSLTITEFHYANYISFLGIFLYVDWENGNWLAIEKETRSSN